MKGPAVSRVGSPSWRAVRIMRRLSRDRWLPGDEVRRLGAKVAFYCAGSKDGMWSVYRTVIDPACETVGMVRGEPVARIHSPEYRDALKTFRDRKSSMNASAEIEIFKFKLRNM